ncbi:DNA-3-methyladenine glycosylase [Paenibacillus sp. N1-5-1-14]|uniref:DNA-3-methyladenine glycosylase family protein n=1 Tax=Paenibacillus radicibacter TaxID=2972488 RepID=UPI00215992A1|nr:DNA-3-methyladenine glycosylase [Paenibacillus radicibacter]MCR8643230.1 DNA-3-methyladenine glycosylase [Paenibacillus radicibacter]
MPHEHHLTIKPQEPFNYTINLGYLARSSNECMYVIDDKRLIRMIPVGDTYVIAEVNSPDDHVLHIKLRSRHPLSPKQLNTVKQYVTDWFDLDTDLDNFYEQARGDDLLRNVVTDFHGLRILGISDLFEALCWGILGQQINLAFAYTLKRRLVEQFGTSCQWEGHTLWAFPTPETLAQLEVNDLTPLQLTTRKAEYIIGVAKLMSEGSLSKDQLLQHTDLKSAEKELVKIRGIGPWTANYVCMRCLRFLNSFPIEDVGLHNAIKQLLNLEKKPSIAEIRGLSTGWAGWEAYATFYLWRTIY